MHRHAVTEPTLQKVDYLLWQVVGINQNRPQPIASSCCSQRPSSGSPPICTRHLGVWRVSGRRRVQASSQQQSS